MKRTETIVETQEVWIIRSRRAKPVARCAECAEDQSEMLTPEGAAYASGLSQRAIYRLVEAGRVHFAETPNGMLFICSVSLSAAIGGGQTQESSPTRKVVYTE